MPAIAAAMKPRNVIARPDWKSTATQRNQKNARKRPKCAPDRVGDQASLLDINTEKFCRIGIFGSREHLLAETRTR